MGILDTFSKKKKKEQLSAFTQKEESVSDVSVGTKKSAPRKKSEEVAAPVVSSSSAFAHSILVRPLISEKAMEQEGRGVYTFVVQSGATKVSVKQAMQQRYGVVPASVRIVNTDGKQVRFGRYAGRRSAQKKAIITLPKGKTISIHTGV